MATIVTTAIQFVAKDAASSTVGKMGKAIAASMAAVTAATVAAGAAMIKLATHAATALDKAFVTAQRLNVSTEFLSRMGFAAEQAGNTSEELTGALESMQRRISDQPNLFKKWQIATRGASGELKSVEQVTLEVADRMKRLKSGADRSAMAMDLMSEKGRKLLPLFMDGADGLRSMMEEADKFGATIDTLSARLGNELLNQMGKTNTAIEGLKRTMGTVLIPFMIAGQKVIQGLVLKMRAWVIANREVANSKIQEFLQWLANSAIPVVVQGMTLIVNAWLGWKGVIIAVEALTQKFFALLIAGVSKGALALGLLAEKFGKDGLAKELMEFAAEQKRVSSQFDDDASGTAARLLEVRNEMEANKKTAAELGKIASNAVLEISKEADAITAALAAKGPGIVTPGVEGGRQGKDRENDAKQAAKDAAKAAKDHQRAMDAIQRANEAAQKSFFDTGIAATQAYGEVAIAAVKGEVTSSEAMKRLAIATLQATGQIASALFTQTAAKTAAGATNVVVDMSATAANEANKASSVVGWPASAAVIPAVIAATTAMFAGLLSSFADGGLVTGGTPGTDSVPALLMPGEFVLRKDIVDDIRKGRGPGSSGGQGRVEFADGGMVHSRRSQRPTIVIAPTIQQLAPDRDVAFRRTMKNTVVKSLSELARDGIKVRNPRSIGEI